MSAGPALRIENLSKAFDAPVLRGLDLEVDPGTFTAVLGPSGCGKTTLLRLIAGFERADAGRIAVGGRVVSDPSTHLAAERRGVGFVPQEGALFPHLDVDRTSPSGWLARSAVDGGCRSWSTYSTSAASGSACRMSFPAASSSASRWPARSRRPRS